MKARLIVSKGENGTQTSLVIADKKEITDKTNAKVEELVKDGATSLQVNDVSKFFDKKGEK